MPLTSDTFHDFPPAARSIKRSYYKSSPRFPRRRCVWGGGSGAAPSIADRVGLKSIPFFWLFPCPWTTLSISLLFGQTYTSDIWIGKIVASVRVTCFLARVWFFCYSFVEQFFYRSLKNFEEQNERNIEKINVDKYYSVYPFGEPRLLRNTIFAPLHCSPPDPHNNLAKTFQKRFLR